MSERDDYADHQLPPPARVRRWLLALAVGVGTFVGVLVVAAIVIRTVPVTTNGADSKGDFAEWISAMEIGVGVAAVTASLAATVAGIVAFRGCSHRQRVGVTHPV